MRGDIGGQDAALGFVDTDILAAELTDAGEYVFKRVINRDHAFCYLRQGILLNSLTSFKFTRLAAGFVDQADITNTHGPVNRFAHVINRQSRDRDSGQGFHLDAGLTG